MSLEPPEELAFPVFLAMLFVSSSESESKPNAGLIASLEEEGGFAGSSEPVELQMELLKSYLIAFQL